MKAATALLVCALVAAAAALAPIDRETQRAVEKGQPIDIFVYGPERVPRAGSAYAGMTRAERRVAVHDAKVAHNKPFQGAVAKLVEAAGFEYKTYWIANTLLVKAATPALVEKLRAMPNVQRIDADKVIAHLHEPMVHEHYEANPKAQALQWNIELINTPAAWEITRGENTVLSNIDTGVRYTHEAVIDSYRGNDRGSFDHDYNWLDPRGTQQVPFDNNGHGTHTMGTIVGSEASGVGVAPGAKWIAAKGCASSSCSTADLIESSEYVLCPTRQDGSQVNCTLGADVMSNSWGGGQGSSTYLPYIEAWIEAGSIPVFSQGNSGSSCSTANSPGDLAAVIGVGSTSQTDALSSFSSRGPGLGTETFPRQKPEISAPGERVTSAYYTSDTAYSTLSGTSMAAPHVSGLVGLMMSANPSITYEQILDILFTTSVQGLPAPAGIVTSCGGVPYTTYPNFFYGYGRIDALAAVQAAQRAK